MGYYLRSSKRVSSDPAAALPRPGTSAGEALAREERLDPVSPLFLPSSFDFLAQVSAALEEAPSLTVEEDLGAGMATSPAEGETTEEADRDNDGDDDDSCESEDSVSVVDEGGPPGENSRYVAAPNSEVEEGSGALQSNRNRKRRRRRQQQRQKGKTWPLAEPSNPDPGRSQPRGSKPNRSKAKKRLFKRLFGSSEPIRLTTDTAELGAAKGAHTGKRGTAEELGDTEERRAEWDLPELLARGFQHVEWEGDRPVPVIDSKGRVCGGFFGQPNDPTYVDDAYAFFDLLMEEGEAATTGPHNRGAFPAFNRGISMGMGNKSPVCLNNRDMNPVLDQLVGHKAVRRVAQYQNSVFKLWAPRVYAEYEKTLDAMYEAKPTLPGPNFDGVVFTAAAFNFGGKVRSYIHRDHMNWAFGLCAITALGRFDPTRSARLILWEWKLVVDFPHAASALIPSSIVTHSNTPLAPGDQRCSFTQYSAGAIFRWVENGCMTEETLKNIDPRKWKQAQEKKETAYLERVENFSHLDELVAQID